MGDTLSQEEIDNLLKAFNDGDLNADDFNDNKEKQVKNYDFARFLKTMEDFYLQIFRHILEKMFRSRL